MTGPPAVNVGTVAARRSASPSSDTRTLILTFLDGPRAFWDCPRCPRGSVPMDRVLAEQEAVAHDAWHDRWDAASPVSSVAAVETEDPSTRRDDVSGKWVVRDRVLHDRNGNGVWADAPVRLGAEILRLKIVAGRYRGSRAWRSWRRTGWYTAPPFASLIVERSS